MAERTGERPAHQAPLPLSQVRQDPVEHLRQDPSSVESPSTWRTYRHHAEDSNLYRGDP
jgi:hypothetical protein